MISNVERGGGRRLLMPVGAIRMHIRVFIITIVGVTAGHINPVTQAVNLPSLKVFCLSARVFFSLSNLIIPDAYIFWSPFLLVDLFICLSSLSLGDLLYG